MSTTRRVAIIVLCSAALSASAYGEPPLSAAMRRLPPSFADRILGAHATVDTLWVRPGGAVAFGSVPRSALATLEGNGSEVSFGAIRFPMLDVSGPFVNATSVRAMRGLTGRGVAVGIVDTGCDVRHADLRTADGHTRIAWLIDLSRAAIGVHADLESRFGIVRDGTLYGAVYNAADLDALLGQTSGDLPTDEVGHGTYVASIAAGSGLATGHGQPSGRFVGMAPEATLLVARANEAGTDRITDAAIVAGAAFVFDRATAMGVPLAVNLSIGSHFGTHDGSTALEHGLVSLLGTDVAGRGLAVAAGNEGLDGIHARVDLASDEPGEVIISLSDADVRDLTVVQLAYENSASLAVRFPTGDATGFVDAGQSQGFASADGQASIANATDVGNDTTDAPMLTPGAPVHGATVVFSGDASQMTRRRAGRYAILVRGSGTVHAWIAEPGVALPRATFLGGAVSQSTISVPATSPSFVSVGAVATRSEWTTVGGGTVMARLDAAIGHVAAFSSLGPNRVNQPVPDLAAPGEWIVAAMSAQATPDRPLSVFAQMGGRLVEADGVHAAARGSSAAAPHVTGAMALLLEAHPNATQSDLRIALTSAPRDAPSAWDDGVGWGTLRIDTALAQLDAMMSPGAVDTRSSGVSTTLATVASNEPVSVLVRLVDANGSPIRESHAVALHATEGTFDGASTASLGGGLYEGRWRATHVAPATTVTISASVDGADLTNVAHVLVVRDVANGSNGYTSSGGCSAARGRSDTACWLLVALAVMAVRRR
jgi:subtilisin family serine protease